MKKLIPLAACALFAIACGSPAASNTAVNRANSSATDMSANTKSPNENMYSFASNSELGRLAPSGKAAREIVGKTANEIRLWQNKEVDPRLRDLMGADYATMKKFWNAETPIRKFGDFLMMTGCEQHNCADNQYVIFMDMGEGNINVVHIGKDTIKEWKDRDIVLPPPFADELKAMKSHK